MKREFASLDPAIAVAGDAPDAAAAPRAGAGLPSICFVAPTAYPVLARSRDVAFVGGAEVQQCLIARELARRGHAVSMVCMDHGQPDGERIDGVRVLKAHTPDGGIRVLRFVHPRLTSLWRAMALADADVYYQRGHGMLAGVVAAFAIQRERASVFAAAHDADFFVGPERLRYARDRLMYRWGVRRMDRIVVQTDRQAELCYREYGRDAVVVPSCYDHVGFPGRHDGHILWVATAKRYKRPHLFVELAKRLPQYRFRLVGGPERSDVERRYHAELLAAAAGVPNLELTGFVPYADIEPHFDGASVFVNTSVGEGFPNTFLQAWSRGIPTVSFFDPMSSVDGVPVGCVVRNLDDMAAQIERLKRDAESWRRTGERARSMVERRHSIRSVADAYQRVFGALVAGGTAR